MQTIDWDRLSSDDAKSLRDHIAGREQVRLIDLAHAIRDTGGPLAAMDGTRESLATLWEWFAGQTRAGFPGIPDLRPALDVFWDFGLDRAVRRSEYAAEPISHYVALVARSYRDYEWAVWPAKGRVTVRRRKPQQGTTVLIAGDSILPVDFVWNFANPNIGFLSEDERLEPDRILKAMDVWLDDNPKPVNPPSGLATYANMPLVPLDDPRRIPPRRVHPLADLGG